MHYTLHAGYYTSPGVRGGYIHYRLTLLACQRAPHTRADENRWNGGHNCHRYNRDYFHVRIHRSLSFTLCGCYRIVFHVR